GGRPWWGNTGRRSPSPPPHATRPRSPGHGGSRAPRTRWSQRSGYAVACRGWTWGAEAVARSTGRTDREVLAISPSQGKGGLSVSYVVALAAAGTRRRR